MRTCAGLTAAPTTTRAGFVSLQSDLFFAAFHNLLKGNAQHHPDGASTTPSETNLFSDIAEAEAPEELIEDTKCIAQPETGKPAGPRSRRRPGHAGVAESIVSLALLFIP